MSESNDSRESGARSRRGVLRAAVAGVGAVAAVGGGGGGARADERRCMAPVFVLVHGAWGNSYGWAPLLAELALRGHRAVAVDLPGHGPGAHYPVSYQAPQDPAALRGEPSPLGKVTLDDFAEHVVGVVRRAARLGAVVLVGRSMGGVTLNAVANRVPELLSHLVYASAFCPTGHASAARLLATPEASTSALSRLEAVRTPPGLGVHRFNWRSADPAFFAAAKEAFAADRPDDAVRALLATLEPDESAAIATDDARGLPETWGRVSRTFLRFTEDRALPLPLQDLMIREADAATPGNRFRVRSLAAPHAGPRDAAVWADELELAAGACR
ncbi:alpha/beta hydrolase [Streptomyces sp. NPDC006670]|uniref:alpha/beta fold hydrolase n=1 Tax=Streptomyces sp. NPDC006670 TaxID=3154476 RepID=UPI0033E55DEA